MKTFAKCGCSIAALLLCLVARPTLAALSAPATLAELPDAATARQAIMNHPMVRAAHAGLEAGAAQRDRLLASPHEFEVTVGRGRRIETATGTRLQEKEVILQRGVRLPKKFGTDAMLGEQAMQRAEFSYGDAQHESARLLLRSWFGAKREALTVANADVLARTWEEQLRVTRRRVEHGDVALLEQSLAEAQLAQANAQRAAARNRLDQAVLLLQQHFPGLPAPSAADLPEPPEPSFLAAQAEEWLDRIRVRNHELAVARVDANESRLIARRAEQDRIPDPKLGLRWASELGGQEKVLGLQLVMTLPGGGRIAASRGADAEAAAADAREAAVLARVDAEARGTLMQVDSSYRQSNNLDSVARRMEANAGLLDKAWRLGEGNFADLINARRLAGEARLAAALARADAQEAFCRLMVDAHFLWSFDDQHDAGLDAALQAE